MDLTAGRGIWLYEQADLNALPILNYYQKIYNEEFSKQIGIIEVKITDGVLAG